VVIKKNKLFIELSFTRQVSVKIKLFNEKQVFIFNRI